MSWTGAYWDLLERLYWSPQYLGLKSIPQDQWTVDGDTVSIPKDLTNKNGPLYRRIRSGDEYWTYVHRQEEVLNYLFDLTFAVLPGDAIGRILHPFTGAGAETYYEMLGVDLCSRYGAKHHANITTPDGFFVAPSSIVGLELKFNAKASRDQLAKYVMLFCAEEQHTGERDHLDLIFVFNCDPSETFEKQIGLRASECRAMPLERLVEAVHNNWVTRYFSENMEHARSTLSRLRVHCTDWTELTKQLSEFSRTLDPAGSMGDRTLKRLLDGLVTEIHRHPLSNARSDHLAEHPV